MAQRAMSIVLVIFLFSCDTSFEPDYNGPDPIASVYFVPEVLVGSYIELDAFNSYKGHGDTLIYKWEKDHISRSHRFIPALSLGKKLFTLIVNNGIKDSRKIEIKVNVVESKFDSGLSPERESFFRYLTKRQLGEFTEADYLRIDSIYNDSRLEGHSHLRDLSGIEKCKNLEYLVLGELSEINLTSLRSLSNLKHLLIQGTYGCDLSPISKLITLEHLEIIAVADNVDFLKPLKNLKELILSVGMHDIDSNDIFDFSFLSDMKNLEKLNFDDVKLLDCYFLNELSNLKYFISLRHNFKKEEFEIFRKLDKMKELIISGNGIESLEPIKDLVNINRLWIADGKISELSYLKNYKNLMSLNLYGNQIQDISPLVENDIFSEKAIIILKNNPLNILAKTLYIPELQKRGATVYY